MHDKYTTLVFLVNKDNILLAMKKRGFGVGNWNGVGGKIEPNETLEQALVRETEEEIFVTPLQWHKVAETDFIMDCTTNTPWHIYTHIFFCTSWVGEPKESEEMAPLWYKKDTLPFDSMWPDDRFWLPKVIDGQKIVGSFYFDSSNRLLKHSVENVDALPGIIATHKDTSK